MRTLLGQFEARTREYSYDHPEATLPLATAAFLNDLRRVVAGHPPPPDYPSTEQALTDAFLATFPADPVPASLHIPHWIIGVPITPRLLGVLLVAPILAFAVFYGSFALVGPLDSLGLFGVGVGVLFGLPRAYAAEAVLLLIGLRFRALRHLGPFVLVGAMTGGYVAYSFWNTMAHISPDEPLRAMGCGALAGAAASYLCWREAVGRD